MTFSSAPRTTRRDDIGHLKYATIGAIWADYGSRIMATLADEGLQNLNVCGGRRGEGGLGPRLWVWRVFGRQPFDSTVLLPIYSVHNVIKDFGELINAGNVSKLTHSLLLEGEMGGTWLPLDDSPVADSVQCVHRL